MGAEKPKFTYVSAELFGGTYGVFVVHDDAPEWYRLVATFLNKAQAQDYTAIENDFRPGGVHGFTEDDCQLREDTGPVPDGLPPEPVSRLSLHQVQQSYPDLLDPSHVPGLPAEAPAELPAENEQVVDAALLPSLTPKQARVFAAIVRLGYANWHTETEIEHAAGINEAGDSITALRIKGYIEEDATDRPARYRPIAVGEPRIEIPKSQNSWTEDNDAALKAMCESGGDFALLAAQIGRTEAACRTRASTRGWYRIWSDIRYKTPAEETPVAEAAPEPIELPEAPVPEPEAVPEPAPEPEPVAAPVTLNDLSARAKNVLKGIAIGRDVADKDFPDYVGVEEKRLAFLLQRLQALGCIELHGGRWRPTPSGFALAENVPMPTTISTPVIRHVQPTATPAKVNGHRHEHHVEVNKVIKPADGRIDAVEYLERKGRSVTRLGGGSFLVDGERRSLSDVVLLVNGHRRAAELPAKSEAEIW